MTRTLQDPRGPTFDAQTMIRECDLATRWRKSIRTLQRWRGAGYGPTPIRLGSMIYYRLEDIHAFEAGLHKAGGHRA